jgi:hypothetical protein
LLLDVALSTRRELNFASKHRVLIAAEADPGGDAMTAPSAAPRPAPYDVRERFQQLSAEWKERSRHLSNTAQMAMLKPYQQIIGMGERALPLILEELQREPDHWFWALEAITHENPVPPEAAGKLRQKAEAWIAWGKRQGYLAA